MNFDIPAFMFYGSKFDVIDLPLPRNGIAHDWALLHEESPKNVPALSHLEVLELFNLTATFSRKSHFPITLQYLKNKDVLTDMKYFVPLNKKEELLSDLAPIIYVHSDCSTPLERDAYAQELMKYIQVDSYGKCKFKEKYQSTKIITTSFLHFISRYKFTLSFENAVCEDYITEKLWRPLIVGSVPIYMGSPSVRDWLPNKNSAILASDFKSPKELAQYILTLNSNITKYKSHLQHKLGNENEKITNNKLLESIENRKWGIDNDFDKGNFIEHFECYVCKHEHKKIVGDKIEVPSVNTDHYNCSKPISPLSGKENAENWWLDQWYMGRCEARVLKKFIEIGKNDYKYDEFYDELKNMFTNKSC
ncbi:hypothetical protein L9F63_011755 [Diploptera punctata]|uniref:Fucosyltransferase n=1 Tax=Diploptera punctata TaxID=6984 RepID=A0AAD8AE55_DIPPU|nr:hypothetical protein L9F63_011755 [Diploptera punctata]